MGSMFTPALRVRVRRKFIGVPASLRGVATFLLAAVVWAVMLFLALSCGPLLVCLKIASAVPRKFAVVLEGVLRGLDGALSELDEYLVDKVGKIGLRIEGSRSASLSNPFPLGLALISFAAMTLQELTLGSPSPGVLEFGLWFTGGVSVFLLLCLFVSLSLSTVKYPYLGSGRLVRSAASYSGLALYIAVAVLMRNLVKALSVALNGVEPGHYRLAAYWLFYAGVAWILLWFFTVIGRAQRPLRIALAAGQILAAAYFLCYRELLVAAVYLGMAVLTYSSAYLVQRMAERGMNAE